MTDITSFKQHVKVYAPNPSHGQPGQPEYVRGTVLSASGPSVTVQLDRPKIKVTRDHSDFRLVEACVDSDNMSVDYLHPSEPGVMENLTSRYTRGICYTGAGGTLVAVNPWEEKPGVGGWESMKADRERIGEAELEAMANAKVSCCCFFVRFLVWFGCGFLFWFVEISLTPL